MKYCLGSQGSVDGTSAPRPASTGQAPRPWRVAVWLWLNLIALGIVLSVLFSKLLSWFEEVKMPLPWPTEMLCSSVEFVSAHPLAWGGLTFVFSHAFARVIPSTRLAQYLATLLVAGLVVAVIWSWFLPFLSITQGISRR